MAEALLSTRNLVKRYGGLTVTNEVSLDIFPSEFHAIIGPNGAGKTTLLSQITGEISPSAGGVHFAGEDITTLSPQARVSRGIARSFQITSIFPEFTVRDNVALGIQARSGHSFRFWRDARSDPALIAPAAALLEQVGLLDAVDRPAVNLSHGEKRALEIAMALAVRPRLLLLDEPMAGMGSEDSGRMLDFLRTLKGSVTVVLIEHDMDTVFALADRLTVMVYGRVIATGSPAAIAANVEVCRAYLGEET